MTKYKVRDLPEACYFSKTVYLGDSFFIASPETPVSEKLKKFLLKWEFREISSEGVPGERIETNSREKADKGEVNDDEQMIQAVEFYGTLRNYAENLLDQLSAKDSLDYKELREHIKEFCTVILDKRQYMLRVLQHTGTDDKVRYLASHGAKSTILSIIFGTYLKLNNDSLIDLGVAALVHELGMINISSQVYQSTQPLTREERRSILTHPILGFNMLKSLNFPQNIRLAVLEHHERENGSGYPQRLSGDKISLFAKIIAVACSYEAITAARSYRDAQDGHTGILNLLKNEGNAYDERVIRALVYSLSVYPIGTYVLLSDGKKAQVVDVNPVSPKYPLVRVMGENADLETSAAGVRVVRTLSPEEASS